MVPSNLMFMHLCLHLKHACSGCDKMVDSGLLMKVLMTSLSKLYNAALDQSQTIHNVACSTCFLLSRVSSQILILREWESVCSTHSHTQSKAAQFSARMTHKPFYYAWFEIIWTRLLMHWGLQPGVLQPAWIFSSEVIGYWERSLSIQFESFLCLFLDFRNAPNVFSPDHVAWCHEDPKQ